MITPNNNPFNRIPTKQPAKSNLNAVPKVDASREQLKKKILDALEPDRTIDISIVKVESSKLAESIENEVYSI